MRFLTVCVLLAIATRSIYALDALYFQTNDPAGNHIVVHAIQDDGTVEFVSTEYAGGLGGALNVGHPDALFSQDSVVIGRNFLYAVNAGSNTIATFKIEPSSPTTISFVKTVPSGGDFPISLAYSDRKSVV